MEDDLLFNFQVDASALKILVKALDRYVEKWPGGKPSEQEEIKNCLLYTSPSPRDLSTSRMPSSA